MKRKVKREARRELQEILILVGGGIVRSTGWRLPVTSLTTRSAEAGPPRPAQAAPRVPRDLRLSASNDCRWVSNRDIDSDAAVRRAKGAKGKRAESISVPLQENID